MVAVRIVSPNAKGLAFRIKAISPKIHAAVASSTRVHGQLLLTKIKAKASGRPGPNAPTGDYRRSWNMVLVSGIKGTVGALVGTNRPQGRRLEYGFVGADSLGRVYNQPPYPHVGPAVDEIEPMYVKDLETIVAKGVEST